ncbi:MAG TPA: pitrilysin family protein [Geobacteraceae bacterium]
MRIILFRTLCTAFFALALLFCGTPPATAADVVRATLENGLRVIIVPNTLAPAVAVQLNYLVGADETPPGFPGMAHAQEHMMFRGSPGLTSEQLSAITAAIGGDTNADTQQTVTQYVATVAAEDLETVLHIEAIRMAGVLDSEKGWAEERGAIEQEVAQDLSNPEYLLSVRLRETLFAGTPYEHDGLGTRPSFQRTTAAMLQKFHRNWYAPNNAILVIVGNVDPGRTLKKVRRLFGKIPARSLPSRPAVDLQPLKPAFFELESNLSYGLAVVAYRLPGFESPDYAAGQVLADVLASQRGNLYALVTQGKALATSFEGMELPKGGAGFATAAFPQGGDGKALIAQLKEIVAGYVKNGIPSELVEAAKRHEVADAEFGKNSIPGLASIWSQAVAVEGRNSPDDDIAAVRRVTVEDVNRVARAYLANDTAVTALLVARASGRPAEAQGFTRGKESFGAKNVKPVKLPAWASALTKALPTAVGARKPIDFRLANGLRLVVVPTAANGTVGVYGEVKNNPFLETPAGKEGVDSVLGELFSYGTTSLDRLDFQAALDEIAAEESAGTSFSLNVLKEHFGRGVELLADNLLHPALPEDAFKVVQAEAAAARAGELQSPGWLAGRALDEGLYPKGDPKLRHATPETLASLTLDDVRRYHRTVFRPDLTTIVVIGAVTPAEAKGIIEKYFGSWLAEGPRPAIDFPPVPPSKPSAVNVPDKSRLQDEVTLVETLGLMRKDPDYYPLQVGLHVLSGGFYATRLYHDLRERAGLVYTIEAFLHAGRTRSLFGIFYGCDPENVAKARALVERNLDRMRRAQVSPHELRQAKTLLLRQMLLARTGTGGIAAELLDLSLMGLPLDEPARAAERYRATTAEKVRKAFARWIRPTAFVQVVRGPAPQ